MEVLKARFVFVFPSHVAGKTMDLDDRVTGALKTTKCRAIQKLWHAKDAVGSGAPFLNVENRRSPHCYAVLACFKMELNIE